MLSGRRQRQIFQTVTVRLDEGQKGPPASYSEEEKQWYLQVEKNLIADKKAGKTVNYDFPNDYDW